MKVSKAANLWFEYHQCHSKENSIRAYKLTLKKFCDEFGDENIDEITTEKALSFLNRVTEGKPSDYLLKASPVEFRGIDEPCPVFDKFLMEIFSENEDLIEYVQRLFRYAITGMNTELIFPDFHGQGRNGKGTLVETISKAAGSYAGPIQAEMLLDQGRSWSFSIKKILRLLFCLN